MKTFFDSSQYGYFQKQQIDPQSFQCGYCNNPVTSDRGYKIGGHRDGSGNQVGGVYICPSCQGALFCDVQKNFYPKPTMGNAVQNLPPGIAALYSEARACCGVGGYTAAVLSCRKILMHIAVDLGAEQNKSFMHYVEWMHDNHHIPPKGKTWVDHIRSKGNEANHEITIAKQSDAERLIKFTEMLLKVNYEFPGSLPKEQAPTTPSTIQ